MFAVFSSSDALPIVLSALDSVYEASRSKPLVNRRLALMMSALYRLCPRLSAGRPAWLDDQLRNRLWAMTFLQAAAREGDAAERDGLRRRAAELLLPRKRVDRTA